MKGYSEQTVKGRRAERGRTENFRMWCVSVDLEVKESMLMIFSLGFGNQNKLFDAVTMLCMLIESHASLNWSNLP